MAITLVAGISSSGKSTYLEYAGCRPAVIAANVAHIDDVAEHAFLHYNTLRYANRKFRTPNNRFRDDPLLEALLSSGRTFDVRYMFCRKTELLRRIHRRTFVERGQGRYDASDFSARVRRLDYAQFHADWLNFFAGSARSVRMFHAHDGVFTETCQTAATDALSRWQKEAPAHFPPPADLPKQAQLPRSLAARI